MSYTQQLKNQLTDTIEDDRERNRAELAEILFSNGRVDLEITTENPKFARYIFNLFLKLFGKKGKLTTKPSKRFKKHNFYLLQYEDVWDELKELKCIKKGTHGYYSPVLAEIPDAKKALKRSFLKGIFLSSGSLSDPHKNYHLEIDSQNDAILETGKELLEGFGIHPGISERKYNKVLFLKDSEDISDVLGLIGANKALLEIEDIKIQKQIRSDINRQVNCDTANIHRSWQASEKQIGAINALINSDKFKGLEPKLKEAAKLRLEHPDMSIKELAQTATPPMSRSTLYRRLKEIVELTENG